MAKIIASVFLLLALATGPGVPATASGVPIVAPGISASGVPTTPGVSAYDVLATHQLPRGILPEGVTSYTLNGDSTFDVHFGSECHVRRGGFEITYDAMITGCS
uniref:Uncharacterized protein n=1 Tax=Leersia perrieri TaxID=77586 RepID=A0A0D9VH73_9ORYZ